MCVLKGHTHPHFYSSTIDNSQSMERAQMSVDGWVDKEDVVCIYTTYIHVVCMYVYIYIYIYIHRHTIKKNEILPFATTSVELEGIVLSEISQRKTNIWFHSYVEFKKQNIWTQGKEHKDKIKTERKINHKRLLNTENKLRVAEGLWVGGWAKWLRGIKEDTCWDEHWVLYTGDESRESTPAIIIALYAN